MVNSYKKLSSRTGPKGKKGNEIFLNDPVFDCLEWWPTFIEPPETTTDVDDVYDVVSRIRSEAREYLKKKLHKRSGPFSTVEGCVGFQHM